jgi:hypothetical protein
MATKGKEKQLKANEIRVNSIYTAQNARQSQCGYFPIQKVL